MPGLRHPCRALVWVPGITVLITRTIQLPDGRSLHLREWGESGPACLLLHGFGEGGYIWEHLAVRLARRYRVYAVDLCGHGDSDWLPSGCYSTTAHVADIEALLEALRIFRTAVIGHSLGGAIAVRLAARAPQVVFRMVIADYGLAMSEETSVHTRDLFIQQCRLYGSAAAHAEQLAASRSMADPAILERLSSHALRRLPSGQYELKCDPRIALPSGDDGQPGIESQLRAIRCPVLLVRGRLADARPLTVASLL